MSKPRTKNKRQLRSCTCCQQLFIGVVDGLCLKCEKNSEYYQKTRQKGEPRDFLDYAELLEQWRARRRECIMWRKEAIKYSNIVYLKRCFEIEKSVWMLVMTAVDADLDVVEELYKQIEELKEQNVRLETRVRIAEQRLNTPYVHYRHTDNVKIPQDHWRRLVQLVHPDKHSNSKVSTEVMQWLLKNKP
jgi:hypothetical protein